MQRTSFGEMQCPVARSLERVGEWWSILILRDAFYGVTRFDDFQKGLGVAPTVLTKRLGALVEAGLLERRPYQERPQRFEYVLTARGRDFRPVMLALIDWGNRHFAPEGLALELQTRDGGASVVPAFVERDTGRQVALGDVRVVAGPVASSAIRQRLDRQSGTASPAPTEPVVIEGEPA